MNSSVKILPRGQQRPFYGRLVPHSYRLYYRLADVDEGTPRAVGMLVGEKSNWHSCVQLESKIKRHSCTELIHFLKNCEDENQTAICCRWVASRSAIIKEYHKVGECPYSEYVHE
jgi:hypothetical protein